MLPLPLLWLVLRFGQAKYNGAMGDRLAAPPLVFVGNQVVPALRLRHAADYTPHIAV